MLDVLSQLSNKFWSIWDRFVLIIFVNGIMGGLWQIGCESFTVYAVDSNQFPFWYCHQDETQCVSLAQTIWIYASLFVGDSFYFTFPSNWMPHQIQFDSIKLRIDCANQMFGYTLNITISGQPIRYPNYLLDIKYR